MVHFKHFCFVYKGEQEQVGEEKIAKMEEEAMWAFHSAFLFSSHQKSKETHSAFPARCLPGLGLCWGVRWLFCGSSSHHWEGKPEQLPSI